MDGDEERSDGGDGGDGEDKGDDEENPKPAEDTEKEKDDEDKNGQEKGDDDEQRSRIVYRAPEIIYTPSRRRSSSMAPPDSEAFVMSRKRFAEFLWIFIFSVLDLDRIICYLSA